MMNTNQGMAAVRADWIRRATTMVAVVAAVTTAACEGDNLFSGDGPSFQPRVLGIALPEAVFAGDSVTVRVDAVAARSVRQVIVSVRGAVRADTVIDIARASQQLSAVVKVGVPAILTDTIMIVEAQIADGAGVRSVPKQGVVPAFGPPIVQAVGTPGAVRPGENATVRVTAFGARKISRITVQARGAISRDTSVTISPARSSVTQDVVLAIPTSVADTLINLTVNASDESGFTSTARTGMIPFVIDPPTVAMITPPSVQPDASLNVQVQATAIRQVSEIRLEMRGAVVKDTTITINPKQTSVISYVALGIPGNVSGSEIQLRAFAIDRAGAVSVTSQQPVAVPSGAPVVLTVDAPLTAVGGHLVDVRVNATGTSPIKEVLVRWRGFLADSLKTPETRATISPPRTDVSADFSVRVPCYQDTRTLLIFVTATDVGNAVSPVASGSVTITGNPECLAPDDTTAGPRPRARRLPGVSEGSKPLSFDGAGSTAAKPEAGILPARETERRRRGRRVRRR